MNNQVCAYISIMFYIKKYVLYINMLIFWEFFNTQSDQNILQNTPNCTTFSKFSQGSYHMPLNSPAYACNYK